MEFTKNDIAKITSEMANTTFDENGFIVDEETHQTKHEGWKIVGIKWDNDKDFRPSWIEDIMDGLFEDLDTLTDDKLPSVANYYNKPLSHFKIKYVTIICHRDEFGNIVSKEVA